MKTGRYARLLIVFAVVAAMTAGLFLLPGCGEDKESMQAFAEGIVGVMDQLQSDPATPTWIAPPRRASRSRRAARTTRKPSRTSTLSRSPTMTPKRSHRNFAKAL